MGTLVNCIVCALIVYVLLTIHLNSKISGTVEVREVDGDNILWIRKDRIAGCLNGEGTQHGKHALVESREDSHVVQPIDHLGNVAVIREVEQAVRNVIEKNGGEKKPTEVIVSTFYPESPEQPFVEHFYNDITNQRLYNDSSSLINRLIRRMSSRRIFSVEDMSEEDATLQLTMRLGGNIAVIFKPKRYEVNYSLPDDLYFWHDFPRHFAEISAFHLDRVLGFNRVAPAIGYNLNIKKDILPVASEDLQDLFFASPVGNMCFGGICQYDCDRAIPVCTQNDNIEGSLALLFPPELHLKEIPSPWKREHSEGHKEDGQRESKGYCKRLETEQTEIFAGRMLLDIIDQHVFDFLIGNMDRNHYSTFSEDYEDVTKQTFLVSTDHGSSFAKPYHDEISIAAPLHDCCKIRLSTLKKLLVFTPLASDYKELLSERLRRSFNRDPLGKPMLGEDHLMSVDRRVLKLIEMVHKCIADVGGEASEVVIDDGF